MRRSILFTFIALGAIITGLSGTGLFAALSDTASTGNNRVETAAMASSADLQLATATGNVGSPYACGTFQENLSTGLFTVQNASSTYSSFARACLRNVGSAPVAVTTAVNLVSDTDVACTGDEAAMGDTTCGGDQAGELGSTIETAVWKQDCATGSGVNDMGGWRTITGFTPVTNIGTIAPNQTVCIHFALDYFTPPVAKKTLAQSDEVTWQWTFTGQA
jgi:hypothetical protein